MDHIAADLRGTVKGDRLVALGGGRVIDVTKALAAADGGRAMAIPTTLSGAEMTQGHRHARGVDESTPRVRPAVVVFDPELAASQPVAELAASSLNALGHAVEGAVHGAREPGRDAGRPRGRAAAARKAGPAREPDRDTLALGAMLAGYVIDSTGLGLHHVLAQTLVRLAGIGHGPANAAMLPHTIGALAWRFPDRIDGVRRSGRARRLASASSAACADLGVDRAVLPECADAAAARPQLANTPPAADRAEILALYESAL